jgi:8-oxo-dGTP pyrophosphatase MutT (NUDIX family)
MELHMDASDSPVLAAATLVMLRDAPAGLEVFLLKRHGLSDVLGGVHVFPGGKVDLADARLEMLAHLDAPLHALHAALGEAQLDERTAAGLYVAALREAFEETGVLYAQGVDAEGAARALQLLREGRSFDEMLATLGLRLAASRLQPWSRWITPSVGGVMRKRFDTRFFISATPEGQVALHDGREATDSVWLAPREALRQYWNGLIELAPPQIMSLAHLARCDTVQAALEHARQRPPPVILPEAFEHDGVRIMCYPGDERHTVSERALPGPTRLHYRNRRFEPSGGFEGWFTPEP